MKRPGIRCLTFAALGLASALVAAPPPETRLAPTRTAAPAIESGAPAVDTIWVETLDLDRMVQRRGRPQAAKTVRSKPITLGGVVYPHGIGTQSISEFLIDVKGRALRFSAMVGIDDDVTGDEGTVVFQVWTDDRLAADTGVIRIGDPPKPISVDLAGVRVLQLICDDGGDTSNGDRASWGDAKIELLPGSPVPEPYTMPIDPPLPVASGVSPRPRINGPRIVGGTPGRDFLFLIPASGEGPLVFSARNLPEGLSLDPATGIIAGKLKKPGETKVELSVSGPQGSDRNVLTVVSGERKLALTPPLGWNSWNVWGTAVDAEKVKAAADGLVRSGLAAHGFQYINIDDAWEGERDAAGVLQPNAKFPDMKALADYVHSRGLKLGIYSSPGPRTCGGNLGSYQYEALDAKTWAGWGIDYLKHDWCSYTQIAKDWSLPELKKPYQLMRRALDETGRDIVYSLCQYGYGNVWEWGADPDIAANLWRTTGDLLDVWCNLESVGFRQAGREKYVGPGHWNDTDMLVVGPVGWGPSLHPTRLAPNEQILHITLWVLQAAPLMIGCDLTAMDQFTIDLLTNPEVLDVECDPLGKSNGRVWKEGRLEVWSRPLADGTLVVGLFNRGLEPRPVAARWSDLGLTGRRRVRDLWQRKDLGAFDGSFTVEVPRHGAVLLKIG
ncbi:MAG: NPCBM/NEW2 domain-containing protein [Candidatus Aminicenantales bacterium]